MAVSNDGGITTNKFTLFVVELKICCVIGTGC